MSSTNRGTVRQPDDYYATPAWATRAILPHLRQPKTVLDPFAGTGAILREVRTWDEHVTANGIELDADRAKECKLITPFTFVCDAFTLEWPQQDLILTNPPYSFALQSVQRATKYLTEWGTGQAAFLLRLAFLESKERNAFLRHRMPDKIKVLPRRPAFVNGKTDSCAYAWFVWGPEAHGEAAELSVLEVGK